MSGAVAAAPAPSPVSAPAAAGKRKREDAAGAEPDEANMFTELVGINTHRFKQAAYASRPRAVTGRR
jgi:hypothetical protein